MPDKYLEDEIPFGPLTPEEESRAVTAAEKRADADKAFTWESVGHMSQMHGLDGDPYWQAAGRLLVRILKEYASLTVPPSEREKLCAALLKGKDYHGTDWDTVIYELGNHGDRPSLEYEGRVLTSWREYPRQWETIIKTARRMEEV